MDGPHIAEVAALVGDPARANMLTALIGGQALTATELALTAGVAPSTASAHLAKLLDGELVLASARGRHRYFRLASPAVAGMLETLMAVSASGPRRHRPRSVRDPALAEARTCYNHLAGRVAVAIADRMSADGLIELGEDAGIVTARGLAFLSDFGALPDRGGIAATACRPCLDWSERRLHIGGALGVALLARFEALGWLTREAGSRLVGPTESGVRGLKRVFGVDALRIART